MDKLILAHDLGTSANKATLFGEDGKLVASATHPYESDFRTGGIAEQNPDDWWKAVCITTRTLLESHDRDRVAAIAFSGFMMGCLCVDRNGTPLRPHMLYCDQRATAETDRFVARSGRERIYRISGNPASAVYSGPKYMWVKEHEPEIYARTHKFLNAKDYMTFKLTGRLLTDYTDASGSLLYDLEKWEWSAPLIGEAGLDPDKFPEIVESTAVAGELTRAAADELGLRPGIPVMAGAADGMCAGVGAGSIAPGDAYACIGSSAWAGLTTDRPLYEPRIRNLTFAHCVPGLFHHLGTMLTGGSVYAWLRKLICLDLTGEAEREGVSAYELMNREAASSPPGARGLLFLPYIMGERSPKWNHLARAGFIGLDMTHTRGDMIRAAMEGVTLNLGLIVDIMRDMGVTIDEMVLIGGGARGEIWRRNLADCANAVIARSNYLDEATSIGAAIIAGIGAGMYRDFSVARQFFAIVDRVRPDPANVRMYAERKALFDRVYDALEPLMPEFARARGEEK